MARKSKITQEINAGSIESPPPVQPCFVVGIGASAGGQAALEQIFTTMPADCGLAFVVIMHLHPDGPSYLHEMLGRCTPMPVLTAEDGMSLQPDTVYVIPTGMDLTVAEGCLSLDRAEKAHAPHQPIDRFFQSLAADSADRSIAVLLSGFGIDGSSGIKSVREAGGIILVQEPGSATHPAMPKSAIATGAVDFILPVEEIAPKISEIARGNCVLPHRSCRIASLDDELAAIFRIVKLKTGHDFSSYKQNTVMRRIERRMAMNEMSGIGRYIALLKENPLEAQALCQDILIGVTSFFRDPEAFEVLRREVIPRLLEGRGPGQPVRIWHACCATGEEVYSMAILIREYLGGQGLDAKVQLFATDIDEAAIAQARTGLYPGDIEQDLGSERLNRFFTKTDGRWQVKKQIREMVIFAHHSLIKDPPFSHLDLLVCRNFLIYLNPDMQKRLIALFHQVLKTGGVLFLGNAESVGRRSELFTTIDSKWKIFERLESKRRTETVFPLVTSVRMPPLHRPALSSEVPEPSPAIAAEKLLLERYAPPCVVVSDKFEMVHVSSRLNRYLEVPAGEPTRDILRMASEDLRPILRAAIYKSFAEQKRIEFCGVRVTDGRGETTINLVVEPLGTAPDSRLAMVVFEPGAPSATLPGLSGGEGAHCVETSGEMLIRQLEEQLRVTYEQLQATTGQLETTNESFMSANEELISINEEFQSANEELQSTNEELETSKEELQALNEELITLNAELQNKVEELDQATSNMENLLASSGIATLFLDRGLHIKGFTPAVARIFNLIPTDIGRPFQHLAGKIDWPTLSRDAATVLAGQPFSEVEISTLEPGRCYLKRVFPYRTQAGSIDGIVVTFIDITERKRAETALAESEQRVRLKLESIISPEGDIGNLELEDILDAQALQSLMDDFHKLVPMPMAIIDIKGKVLVGKGWQDICTQFHRVHPEAMKNCLESDLQLTEGITQGEFRLYKCKNNMWDVATPIIVGDRHLGNLFSGQFFFDDEPLDYAFFESQAKQYGFKEDDYIAALERVPRLSREFLAIGMEYFAKFAEIISKLSYSNIKLARSLSERDALMESLRESELFYRQTLESIPGMVFTTRPDGYCDYQSQQWADFTGVPMTEHLGDGWNKLLHPDDRPLAYAAWYAAVEGRAPYDLEYRVRRHDGVYEWFKVRGRPIRNEAGEIVRWFGTAVNIDDLFKAQELVQQHVAELSAINEDLERFNDASVGRELRMVELKQEINEMCAKAGMPQRYALEFEEG